MFNVVHSDIHARKTDSVVGECTLDVPDGEATVTDEIAEMLGEEVLATQAAGFTRQVQMSGQIAGGSEC